MTPLKAKVMIRVIRRMLANLRHVPLSRDGMPPDLSGGEDVTGVQFWHGRGFERLIEYNSGSSGSKRISGSSGQKKNRGIPPPAYSPAPITGANCSKV